ADLVLLESLEDVRATTVLSGGRAVVRDGKLAVDIADPVPAPVGDSVRIGPISTEDFTLKHADGDVRVRVMEIDRNRTTRLGEATVRFASSRLSLPLPDDLALLSVVPRHGQPHRPSLALIRALGLTRGAIATTVAHDSHHLIVP